MTKVRRGTGSPKNELGRHHAKAANIEKTSVNILAFALFALLLAYDGQAQATSSSEAQKKIANVPVLTQSNQSAHFYTDLVQGHLVAINFVFTGCSTVCPLMGARFAALQKQLVAESLPAQLISVGLDPANDTPQSLSEWSRKFGAKPGWTLVTGEKADIDALTTSLGASTADFTAHAPLIVIIDDRRPGAWRRLDGLADTDTIVKALHDVQDAK
jgi:protein SCO1/2